MPLPKKSNEFLTRSLRLLIIGGSILLFAFFVWSAAEARKKTSNRVVDWLPQKTQELTTFQNRYYQHFAEGEYLMVSWKGCTIDDPNISTIADKLTSPPKNGSPPFFEQARTTQSVIDALTEGPSRLTEGEAQARLAGWLIGKDSKDNAKTACLVFLPHPQGWQNPAAAVDFLFNTIEQVTGLQRTDIYVAGTGIDSVAISEIAAKSQRKLLPFFLLFSLVLLLCCLRHFAAGFLVFWVAIINEELAGTVLFWSGAHVDSISMLNASLVYVLTISGSVHLMNYYRKTLAESVPGEEKHVPLQTFYKAILPCSLATFTTILGMGSLGVSKMLPISTFGIFASITLFLGTIWFFLCILSTLQERPIRRWFPKPMTGDVPSAPKSKFWEQFGTYIYKGRHFITIITFASLIVFAFGIERLHTSVTFHGLLPKDAKVLQDYRMLETQIGGLIPIEVVIQFPHDTPIRMLDQVYFLDSLVRDLRQTENVDAAISVLNFLPNLPPQTGGFRAVGQRAAMSGLLDRNQEQLQELRFFHKVDAYAKEMFTGNRYSTVDWGNYWRISLRVSTQKNLNYADMIAAVQKRADNILAAHLSSLTEEKMEGVPKIDVTGGMALVFKAQELLLWDLIYSFMTAFALIALTMMIVLRGFLRGLLAMIPNIFPCVIVFGALGLCDVPVDMGSMMTASVALGISVDSTLHLLTWVNMALRQGAERKDAILYALQRCCTALFQTTIICGIGMLVFSLSDFVPVSRFAMLLCIILMISFIGAIVALPAILFSSLGKFFEPTESDKKNIWGL